LFGINTGSCRLSASEQAACQCHCLTGAFYAAANLFIPMRPFWAPGGGMKLNVSAAIAPLAMAALGIAQIGGGETNNGKTREPKIRRRSDRTNARRSAVMHSFSACCGSDKQQSCGATVAVRR
jgi:hypothetical protein